MYWCHSMLIWIKDSWLNLSHYKLFYLIISAKTTTKFKIAGDQQTNRGKYKWIRLIICIYMFRLSCHVNFAVIHTVLCFGRLKCQTGVRLRNFTSTVLRDFNLTDVHWLRHGSVGSGLRLSSQINYCSFPLGFKRNLTRLRLRLSVSSLILKIKTSLEETGILKETLILICIKRLLNLSPVRFQDSFKNVKRCPKTSILQLMLKLGLEIYWLHWNWKGKCEIMLGLKHLN